MIFYALSFEMLPQQFLIAFRIPAFLIWSEWNGFTGVPITQDPHLASQQKMEDQMNRRQVIAGTTMAAGALALPALAQEDIARSLLERFAATLSSHDIAAFAALFADDYVNHQRSAAAPAPPADKSPKQATVDFFAARLAGIPDLQVAIEAAVVLNDRMAASFVYTGMHGGTYFGIAPTHRPLRFTSCDIFSVRNGLITEHWGMEDIAGVLAQLR